MKNNSTIQIEAHASAVNAIKAANINVTTMASLEALGKANPCRQCVPGGQDVASFCFTSGTTGSGKSLSPFVSLASSFNKG